MREFLLVGLLLFASPALADDKLSIAPPPAWVKPRAEIQPSPLPIDGPPIRVLRLDRQLSLDSDGEAYYQEQISQVRTAVGLQMIGTTSISWDPSRERLTVHKLRIIRDGTPIDILARQPFTVVRREENLTEVVEGRLTASLQPEDLRLGDIVELAYTIAHKDPVFRGRNDASVNLEAYIQPKLMTLRAVWPANRRISWRASPALEKPRLATRGGQTEMVLELTEPEPLKAPSDAPARYRPRREIEFSEFRSWSEVSALTAPDYEAASIIEAGSPLAAELDKIRAASPDKKVQAAAALKLVQDQVRYLALVLTDGGFTPITAERTWERRFGDCKAKSALLIALLRGLGISAEAALVNSFGAPTLDTKLPRVRAFNHVIVRAQIDSKTYWLDGTAANAGSLESLSVPAFDWALPVRTTGGQLIPLTQTVRTAPDAETILEVDAREGLEARSKVTGKMIIRGAAGRFHAMVAEHISAEERAKFIKTAWARYAWIEVKTGAITRDPISGATVLTMEGVAKMRWFPWMNGGLALPLPDHNLGWRADFKREAGPGSDAPFAVPFPSYTAARFAIRLPDDGIGFETPAPDVDATIAGRRFVRRSTAKDGLITIETSTNAVAPEFPASEAQDAGTALTKLAAERVIIQAPRSYRTNQAEADALLEDTPKAAYQFVERGVKLGQAGRRKESVADFSQAIALDPKLAAAYAYRAQAHLESGATVLAKADLEEAEKLTPNSSLIQAALGSLAMNEGRYTDAVLALSRSIDLRPISSPGALGQRAAAYEALQDWDKALADYARILELDPATYVAHRDRARVFMRSNRPEVALKEMDAALALRPNDPDLHLYRSQILDLIDRKADATAALDRSLALKPTPGAYLYRAWRRAKSDLAERLTDIDAASVIDPDNRNRAYVEARAKAYIEAGQPAGAVPLLNAALKTSPESISLMMLRAEALAKSGRPNLAVRDFTAARVLASGASNDLNSLCWTQAILGLQLEAALDDCRAALKLQPASAAINDSNGMVLLRLGRLKDALVAYDEAVRLSPQQAASLYGRGVTKLRLGEMAAAETDFAAARKSYKDIDAEFAGYGVTP